MKARHTPGPWSHHRTFNGDHFISAEGRRGRIELATVYAEAEYQPKLPLEANARLIAAAPELLAALKELVERCDGPEGVRPDGSNIQTIRAHAAIAKAEGEQS